MDECNDPHAPFKYPSFLVIDVLSNVENLSENHTEGLPFQTENFWIGYLVTHDKGLDGSHDWNRHHRIHRDMYVIFMNMKLFIVINQ